MPEPDRPAAVPGQDDGGITLTGLGPPGWAEFAAARERFMRTVAVAALETAWCAPAREPHDGEGEEGRR
jgi:hypothetical protein